MHAAGEIAMLTCYDATFAGVLDAAGVDSLLVGDSLGNVLQGRSSTLAVSIEDMAYHTGCVVRGNKTAWVIADLPFGATRICRGRDAAPPSDAEGRTWSNPKAAAGRHRALPGRSRRPRLWALGFYSAIGARARRLPRAGTR